MATTLHTKQNTLTTLSNIGATGANGQYLTSGGNGATSYNWTSSAAVGQSNVLTVSNSPASLDVKGKVVINGRDLEERLNVIEKVLLIPERDVILEAKHPKLKELYNEYINALGKYRTFEAIKGEDNGTT